ncbi:hypothetical protein ACR9E3_24800 [Actinomycetospora sp. C-140]
MSHVDDVVARLRQREEDRFRRGAARAGIATPPAWRDLPGLPTPMTPGDRERRLRAWRTAREEHADADRARVLGALLSGMRVDVAGPEQALRLEITFHDCAAVERLGSEALDRLVDPVLGCGLNPWTDDASRRRRRATWRVHDGAVTAVLAGGRGVPSSADGFCVVARGEQSSVRVTWVVGEGDAVTTGELDVAVTLSDARELAAPLTSR